MSRHMKTWELWLRTLSPMSTMIHNFSEREIIAMAEALSFAAPYGPVGIECIDVCRCKTFGR